MDCLEPRVHVDDLTCKDFEVNMAQFEQEHDLALLRQFASEVDSHTTDEIQLDSSHHEYLIQPKDSGCK
ncbi:hypothetical protein D9613_003748 [Agrocybe pediades]|uniref:Uncharacterized protein n=1 Tax=Agrocybe pediades TaxID=84607 RepID=A0A8H4QJR1_9AGAR|nr:hypothetical protein D9613_003748 [Agrocybe pediades]